MKRNTNHPLTGKFIKVLSKEHGIKVIRWFKDQGVDTRTYSGKNIGAYYGIANSSVFIVIPEEFVISWGYSIFELPKELTFPKKMLVWGSDECDTVERIVIWHNKVGNPMNPYLAVGKHWEHEFINGKEYYTVEFKNAKELPIVPIINEMTLADVCKALGKEIKIIK